MDLTAVIALGIDKRQDLEEKEERLGVYCKKLPAIADFQIALMMLEF